jgi:uncharacterized protein YyaL (SSP411 family)
MGHIALYTNSLIHETSPYLLQHAHNPVNWLPWSETALQKAKEENKLMIISIGYSACHWCHVMEKESFEDTEVARIMNENFICIKIDREERPDVDQVYMQAVQLMTHQGGWPLNCFTLPDGRPVYGGTYFPKPQWLKILISLAEYFKNNRTMLFEYAEKLTGGMQQSELISFPKEVQHFSKNDLDAIVQNRSKHFDYLEGGHNHAPKFPLPNSHVFLLRYAHLAQNDSILNYVMLSLEKMANGGIYDQIGGGFARYSTDEIWKVPHFEKMLYDNAQLVSLYCEAFQKTGNTFFKNIVYETLEFIERELTSPECFFYSALDADSEGKEGKYYVWTKVELQYILKDLFPLMVDFYNINEHGYWEDDNYILIRKRSDQEICQKYNISIQHLNESVAKAKKLLMNERGNRVRPGLDDKILTSWNALMIKAYVDAYDVFGEENFLDKALTTSENLLLKLKRNDGGLWHSYKNNKAAINGFLEDYAFTIEAFIGLYQATFNEKWVIEAHNLVQYVLKHFYDNHNGMFFFTSDLNQRLIVRKKEIHDNVIPSSNSSIAKSLFVLSHYFEEEKYHGIAVQMLSNIKQNMHAYGSAFSNWAQLLLNITFPYFQLAITGKNALEQKAELSKIYFPNKLMMGLMHSATSLPLLKEKFTDEKTYFYLCNNKSCSLPMQSIDELLAKVKTTL